MTRFRTANQRGFSLLEALFAMAVLGIGFLGVGLMQIGGIKANTNATGRTLGVGLAQSVMDDLRSRPVNFVPGFEDDSSADDPLDDEDGDGMLGLDDGMAAPGGNPNPLAADQSMGLNGQVIASDGRNYTVFWNVADNEPVTGAKTLKLFVYWNDQRFGLNRVVMTTVLGGFYL